MLNLNSGIICDIIARAREILVKDEVSFPEITDDMDANYVLENHAEDLTYQEVTNVINSLRPDQQITLVALMYMGRGDYSKEEWNEAFSMARDQWTEFTGEYLLSRPTMPEDIERGLDLLGITCND